MRRLSTLVRERTTLEETLDQLEYQHCFRGLMQALMDRDLAELIRDQDRLLQITEYTRQKLADWHRPEWACPAEEEPLIVRSCITAG